MLRRVRRYLRDAVRGRRMARDIDQELQFHVEALVDEVTARGVSPEEAHRIAARRFGRLDLMRDEARYAKGVGLIDDLRQDVRYALRRLRREPGFTIVAIVSIGLAIGLNTAMFAVVNGVLLRPLPYKAPDRLVAIWKTMPGSPPFPAARSDFLDWKRLNTVFEDVAATRESSFRNEVDLLTGTGPARVSAAEVTPNLFSLLGVNAQQGRTFLPNDGVPGSNRVVVLGHDTWRTVFDADHRVIGKRIRLDQESYEVVGVLPAGVDFTYPKATGLFVPLELPPEPEKAKYRERAMDVHVYARLKPGVTVQQAESAMRVLMTTLVRQYPVMAKGENALVVPLHEDRFGWTRSATRMLAVAVGLVLLIAAANVANLLLASGLTRSHEMAIRSALGSRRGRLLRQLLTENLLLALAGGTLGLLLAGGGTRVLVALAPPTLPRLGEVRIDMVVLGFTFACATVCGLLFGLLPAFRASTPDIGESLKTGRSTTAGGSRRVRATFVVAEVALVLVLLATAGLMVNSLWRLIHVDLGFDPHNVLAAELFVPNRIWDDGRSFTLPEHQSRGDRAIRALSERLLGEVRRLPGVVQAGTTTCLPLNGGYARRGLELPGSRRMHFVDERRIDPGYLLVMGTRLISGRFFSDSDRDGPPVVLVSRELERAYFPGQSAVGRRLSTGGVSFEIVGVVGDMRERSITAAASPVLYFDAQQNVQEMVLLHLTVRTAQKPAAMADTLQRAVRRVDPELPIRELTTLDDLVARNLAGARFYATVLTVFSLVALALAAVGIHGLLSHAVGQRTREIGVRVALGASRARVWWLVFAEASMLVGVGLAVGLAATWAVTRAIRSFLFNVTPTDPITLVVVTVVLVLVAASAAGVPARRAARIDPMSALRCE